MRSSVLGVLAFSMLGACGGTTVAAIVTGDGGADGAGPVLEAGLDAAADAHHPGIDGGPALPEAGLDAKPEAAPLPPIDAGHALPLIPDNGGPVLSSPLLVTITYANDVNRTFEEALGAFMPTSSWLGAAKEYGVGPGTSAKVELPGNAPATIDDATIQTTILGLITAGTAPDPLADGGGAAGAFSQAVYIFYVPSTTTVTVQGSTLCQISAGGYHYESSAQVNGHTIAYAVVSQCGQGLPVQAPQDLVWGASHEFVEACTDPYPLSAPGYAMLDPNEPWASIGGEVGDLCTFVFPQATEGTYTALQRVYSNASVKAGGDPCEPATLPYFAAAVAPEQWVNVAAGQSTTFQLTGWSTSSVPAWSLQATPYAAQGTGTPSVVLGTSTLAAGQSTTLQVTVPSGTASGTAFYIYVDSIASSQDYTMALAGVYVQ
ncbi:MAG TPA: hypothetical protein VIF09_10375 [Polyangiaceae bacterium]